MAIKGIWEEVWRYREVGREEFRKEAKVITREVAVSE